MWAGFLVALAVLACLGGWWYGRKRKRSDSPPISFVALLREPVTFDPAVLAKKTGKVWKADFGDGSAEGADGFVVGEGHMFTIMHGHRFYLINVIPKPYVEDPLSVSESIGDLRIGRLFSEHRAWFSVDALGGDSAVEAPSAAYPRLAKLFAELLDENCLLILVPETSRAFPINDETERALLSDDPLAALADTLPVPVTQVSDDDPLMRQAVEQARTNWPQFVSAFEAKAGTDFAMKAPVTHSENTEFIWLTVNALEGGRVYGSLANDPADLGPLKLGSKVTVNVSNLNDWCYTDPQGKLQGLFTVAAVQQAARRQK